MRQLNPKLAIASILISLAVMFPIAMIQAPVPIQVVFLTVLAVVVGAVWLAKVLRPDRWRRYQPAPGITFLTEDPEFLPPEPGPFQRHGGECRNILTGQFRGRNWQAWEQKFGGTWEWRFGVELAAEVPQYLVESLEPGSMVTVPSTFPAGFNYSPTLPARVKQVLTTIDPAPEFTTSGRWLIAAEDSMNPRDFPDWFGESWPVLSRIATALEREHDLRPAKVIAKEETQAITVGDPARNVWQAPDSVADPVPAEPAWPAPDFSGRSEVQDPGARR